MLQTSAFVCVVLAVVAAIQSHTLKRPVPIPNFYSAHSWLGLLTFTLLIVQVMSQGLLQLTHWPGVMPGA